MCLNFKSYCFVEVTYLLIRFNKTMFFPWNTKNIDRNGVNKQKKNTRTLHTQRKTTLESVTYYENKWYPLFGKNLNPPPIWEILGNSKPHPVNFVYIFKTDWYFLIQFCSSDLSFNRNILASLYLNVKTSAHAQIVRHNFTIFLAWYEFETWG